MGKKSKKIKWRPLKIDESSSKTFTSVPFSEVVSSKSSKNEYYVNKVYSSDDYQYKEYRGSRDPSLDNGSYTDRRWHRSQSCDIECEVYYDDPNEETHFIDDSEEYTKIQTPRQEVLFKRKNLVKKRDKESPSHLETDNSEHALHGSMAYDGPNIYNDERPPLAGVVVQSLYPGGPMVQIPVHWDHFLESGTGLIPGDSTILTVNPMFSRVFEELPEDSVIPVPLDANGCPITVQVKVNSNGMPIEIDPQGFQVFQGSVEEQDAYLASQNVPIMYDCERIEEPVEEYQPEPIRVETKDSKEGTFPLKEIEDSASDSQYATMSDASTPPNTPASEMSEHSDSSDHLINADICFDAELSDKRDISKIKQAKPTDTSSSTLLPNVIIERLNENLHHQSDEVDDSDKMYPHTDAVDVVTHRVMESQAQNTPSPHLQFDSLGLSKENLEECSQEEDVEKSSKSYPKVYIENKSLEEFEEVITIENFNEIILDSENNICDSNLTKDIENKIENSNELPNKEESTTPSIIMNTVENIATEGNPETVSLNTDKELPVEGTDVATINGPSDIVKPTEVYDLQSIQEDLPELPNMLHSISPAPLSVRESVSQIVIENVSKHGSSTYEMSPHINAYNIGNSAPFASKMILSPSFLQCSDLPVDGIIQFQKNQSPRSKSLFKRIDSADILASPLEGFGHVDISFSEFSHISQDNFPKKVKKKVKDDMSTPMRKNRKTVKESKKSKDNDFKNKLKSKSKKNSKSVGQVKDKQQTNNSLRSSTETISYIDSPIDSVSIIAPEESHKCSKDMPVAFLEEPSSMKDNENVCPVSEFCEITEDSSCRDITSNNEVVNDNEETTSGCEVECSECKEISENDNKSTKRSLSQTFTPEIVEKAEEFIPMFMKNEIVSESNVCEKECEIFHETKVENLEHASSEINTENFSNADEELPVSNDANVETNTDLALVENFTSNTEENLPENPNEIEEQAVIMCNPEDNEEATCKPGYVMIPIITPYYDPAVLYGYPIVMPDTEPQEKQYSRKKRRKGKKKYEHHAEFPSYGNSYGTQYIQDGGYIYPLVPEMIHDPSCPEYHNYLQSEDSHYPNVCQNGTHETSEEIDKFKLHQSERNEITAILNEKTEIQVVKEDIEDKSTKKKEKNKDKAKLNKENKKLKKKSQKTIMVIEEPDFSNLESCPFTFSTKEDTSSIPENLKEKPKLRRSRSKNKQKSDKSKKQRNSTLIKEQQSKKVSSRPNITDSRTISIESTDREDNDTMSADEDPSDITDTTHEARSPTPDLDSVSELESICENEVEYYEHLDLNTISNESHSDIKIDDNSTDSSDIISSKTDNPDIPIISLDSCEDLEDIDSDLSNSNSDAITVIQVDSSVNSENTSVIDHNSEDATTSSQSDGETFDSALNEKVDSSATLEYIESIDEFSDNCENFAPSSNKQNSVVEFNLDLPESDSEKLDDNKLEIFENESCISNENFSNDVIFRDNLNNLLIVNNEINPENDSVENEGIIQEVSSIGHNETNVYYIESSTESTGINTDECTTVMESKTNYTHSKCEELDNTEQNVHSSLKLKEGHSIAITTNSKDHTETDNNVVSSNDNTSKLVNDDDCSYSYLSTNTFDHKSIVSDCSLNDTNSESTNINQFNLDNSENTPKDLAKSKLQSYNDFECLEYAKSTEEKEFQSNLQSEQTDMLFNESSNAVESNIEDILPLEKVSDGKIYITVEANLRGCDVQESNGLLDDRKIENTESDSPLVFVQSTLEMPVIEPIENVENLNLRKSENIILADKFTKNSPEYEDKILEISTDTAINISGPIAVVSDNKANCDECQFASDSNTTFAKLLQSEPSLVTKDDTITDVKSVVSKDGTITDVESLSSRDDTITNVESLSSRDDKITNVESLVRNDNTITDADSLVKDDTITDVESVVNNEDKITNVEYACSTEIENVKPVTYAVGKWISEVTPARAFCRDLHLPTHYQKSDSIDDSVDDMDIDDSVNDVDDIDLIDEKEEKLTLPKNVKGNPLAAPLSKCGERVANEVQWSKDTVIDNDSINKCNPAHFSKYYNLGVEIDSTPESSLPSREASVSRNMSIDHSNVESFASLQAFKENELLNDSNQIHLINDRVPISPVSSGIGSSLASTPITSPKHALDDVPTEARKGIYAPHNKNDPNCAIL